MIIGVIRIRNHEEHEAKIVYREVVGMFGGEFV